MWRVQKKLCAKMKLPGCVICCVKYVVLLCLWQEKITKEMNYILSNQDTVLSQITQLESSITQTEVINTLS